MMKHLLCCFVLQRVREGNSLKQLHVSLWWIEESYMSKHLKTTTKERSVYWVWGELLPFLSHRRYTNQPFGGSANERLVLSVPVSLAEITSRADAEQQKCPLHSSTSKNRKLTPFCHNIRLHQSLNWLWCDNPLRDKGVLNFFEENWSTWKWMSWLSWS